MSGVRGHVRAPVRAAAVILLLFGCVAAAQPENGETLYLVLRVGPDITDKDILKTLKQGLELSNATITGEPTIRPVSAAFFEEFQVLVDRAANPVAAADDGFAIRLLPTRDLTYEIRVAPTQVLKKLKVKYEKGGEKEYTPTAPDGKSQLVLIVPGRYAFMPDPNDAPVSYEGEVAELGKANVPAVKGEWPKGDKYFVVTMRNFKGNRRLLFEVIQDPRKVANPLDNIQLGTDFTFAFASLNSSVGVAGDVGLDPQGNINITVETIPNRRPARVWVYFPLDKAGMEKAKEQYLKFSSEELPGEIRKTSISTLRAAEFGPKDDPKWVELPPEPTPVGVPPRRFDRKVKINDPGEFADRYPQMWMLVVWEFDTGKPEAIIVQHPATNARVGVLERERVGWQKAIQNIPRKK